MPKFSRRSQANLDSCDPRIRLICETAIRHIDFSVVCGHRDQEAQDKAKASGNSKAAWGESKHNSLPSKAVDLAPYPLVWRDERQFARLAGRIEQIADQLGIAIRWGGDWDQDGKTIDETFLDLGHFELDED